MVVKRWIKSKIHPLVWERLGQARQEYHWNKLEWHCDSNLIPIFNKYFSFNNGYYVDVGANDGRASSNTYRLEKINNWNGVLVEPILHLFFRARQIRDLNKNFVINCACVGPDFEYDHIEIFYSNLMSVTNSNTNEHNPIIWANNGGQFLSRGELVQKTWSPARTLESVLLEAKSPKVIDFLSIDVEGGEFGVLKGINFENRIFRFILIETYINSISFQFLIEMGYQHIETIAQNLLFCHKDELIAQQN